MLPLLRYDQVPELARKLKDSGDPSSESSLLQALAEMREDLLDHEWQPAKPPPAKDNRDAATRLRDIYREYLKDDTRDFSRVRVIKVAKGIDGLAPLAWKRLGENENSAFFEAPASLDGVESDAGTVGHRQRRGESRRPTLGASFAVPPSNEDAAGDQPAEDDFLVKEERNAPSPVGEPPTEPGPETS